MSFVDEVLISVESGMGGDGCRSFRREKYIPRGGPNGGNGGCGGDVIIRASRDKHSLLDFRYQPKYQAERGQHGMGKDMDGRSGDSLVILVPPGTLVFDTHSEALLADLVEDGAEFLSCAGGRGGRGNKSFKSSTNRAPRFAQKGFPGEKKELRLELKLLADVGLVGLPNAGKSSFLRAVSHAVPKVADYPFTTLEPSLGMVDYHGFGFCVADLPGLIEGAAEGAGLGHQFLRHVARNRVLLHLVDLSSEVEKILENIKVIEEELRAYGNDLDKKPRWIVWTKGDLLDEAGRVAKMQELKEVGYEGHCISSHTQLGMDALLENLARNIQKAKEEELLEKSKQVAPEGFELISTIELPLNSLVVERS